MKRQLLIAMFLTAFAAGAQAKDAATTASSEQPADNSQLLIEKIKADKKLVVGNNMKLTESEAKKFWPMYANFQNDLEKLNDRLATLITSYGKEYTQDSMNDAKAKTMLAELLAIEDAEVKMKSSWVDQLSKVLPSSKVARYIQIETKIRNLVKSEISQSVPLVP
jgi:hypothetical protein